MKGAKLQHVLASSETFLTTRTHESGTVQLLLRGELTIRHGARLWQALHGDLGAVPAGRNVELDVSQVQTIDGGAMALLVAVKGELERRGHVVEFVGAVGSVLRLVQLYRGDVRARHRKKRRPQGMLDQIGRSALAVILEIKQVLDFFGRVTIALLRTIQAPKSVYWKDIPRLMERAGADAVPIVLLINYLVGFVMGFQSAVQLKAFGANIFVADLVGLSTARELGPLMTAIIVAGRSGAAIAAELGSMTVAEEVDALQTMGFGAIRFLVIPRTVALILVVPLLTLLADMIAIAGGLTVGITRLDLTVVAYMNETRHAVGIWDISSGLLKSAVFALAIAIISCQQGLAASGGAEGVGRRTTASVVTILFTVILIDAAFTVLFTLLGL